ncbi:hypothetical protein HPB49_007226 [Dermacentor silvarum]|uniref:Uncharacterized protein n=1 Tax=Dermacentor silvarum TaxID=543639 RepID=A0ACB8DX64_DERSI|nr:hypothetical protein HPB49_007226 [Dermacentor silvarum]
MIELTLGGKLYEVNACVAAPDGVVRAVVHGIDAGTPPEELMARTRVTSADPEGRCATYVCLKLGHRSDVYPTPELRACRQCGLGNPETGHTYGPKCALTGEAHPIGARECRDRSKKARRPLINDQKNGDGKNYRLCPKDDSDEGDIRGCVSTEGKTSASRSRFRSRSRSTTRCQQKDERSPNQRKKNKNKKKLAR